MPKTSRYVRPSQLPFSRSHQSHQDADRHLDIPSPLSLSDTQCITQYRDKAEDENKARAEHPDGFSCNCKLGSLYQAKDFDGWNTGKLQPALDQARCKECPVFAIFSEVRGFPNSSSNKPLRRGQGGPQFQHCVRP